MNHLRKRECPNESKTILTYFVTCRHLSFLRRDVGSLVPDATESAGPG